MSQTGQSDMLSGLEYWARKDYGTGLTVIYE
jgi:hypothetical protein